MTFSDKYKLLGFIFLFKACRKNSLKYNHETLNLCLKNTKINISYNTFKKYWELCEKLGLIEEFGNHQGIIGWDNCIEILDLGFHRRRINKLIRNYDLTKMTFNEVVEWVEQCVFLLNFQGQQKKIKTKEKRQHLYWLLANDKHTGQANLRNLRTKAKKNGVSLKEYAKSMLEKNNMNVITGSYHLSNKFGLSQKKSNSLLNSMVRKGIIERTIVKKEWFRGEVCAATFDLAKELSGNALIIPLKDTFVQILGSVIQPCLPLV